MTTQRWPRTHERTNTRDAIKREPAAEPKPWLHRRSVRNAPPPTALRVEPWDSEILRTLTDNACKDCGHVRCSCPEQAIEPDQCPVLSAVGRCGGMLGHIGPCQYPIARVPQPAPKAGEREVREGDVWSGAFSGCHYKVLTPGPGLSASAAECVYVPAETRASRHVGERCAGISLGELISRAQPGAVDDGAVNWRDCATAEEALKAAGFAHRDTNRWFVRGNELGVGPCVVLDSEDGGHWASPAYESHTHHVVRCFGDNFRAAIAHALGESPSIARGPVPT